jgi:hypothetical protein
MQDPKLSVAVFKNSLQGKVSLGTAAEHAAIISKNTLSPAALNSAASPLVATHYSTKAVISNWTNITLS